MDTFFNRKAITFLKVFFLLSSFYTLHAESKNDVWIGSVKNIKLISKSSQTLLKIDLEEYTEEGTFDSFDENSVLFLNNHQFKSWSIILDNVDAGKLVKYKKSFPMEKSSFLLQITERQASYSDPNRNQTEEGKEIKSAEIKIVSPTPLYISVDKIDKQNFSKITFYLKISQKIPKKVLQTNHSKSQIEISISDFNCLKPVGKFLGPKLPKRLSRRTKKLLKRLRRISKGTYVTLIYQARYFDVQELKKQIDLFRSDLGETSVIEETARILIRDRSEYVLEMLRVLLALDQPVPQVIIDVHIIERTIERGMDFSSSFSYFRSGEKGYGVSIGNDAPLTNYSLKGVYKNISDDFLRMFQGKINSEIKRGRASLKASTRLICKNRQTAKFNSGNSIPYYKFHEFTQENYDTNTNIQEKSPTSYSSESIDTSGQKSTSKTENIYQRDYRSGQHNKKGTKKWAVTFINTGVNLTVRPYIKNSNLVELYLQPSYTEITSLGTISDIPILSNRSIDTTVTLKNGSTIIVAGLLYEKKLKQKKGVPLLMDIPLLGSLFQSTIVRKRKTEIIFMLTVYIQHPS